MYAPRSGGIAVRREHRIGLKPKRRSREPEEYCQKILSESREIEESAPEHDTHQKFCEHTKYHFHTIGVSLAFSQSIY